MSDEVVLPRRMQVAADPQDPRTIRVRFEADEYIDCIEFRLEQAAELAQRLLRLYYAVEPQPQPPQPPVPSVRQREWERAAIRAAMDDWETNVAPSLPGIARP